MLFVELQRERSGWNAHCIRRVVRWRRVFAEVVIFRDVGHGLHQLVTDAFTASAAVGKDGVAHQDDRGPGFVMVADFIDAGALDQLSGTQGTVRLVKDLRVFLGHFMPAPLRRRPPSLSRQTCRGRSRGVGSAWEENGLRANGLEVKPLLRLRARNSDAKRTREVGKFPRLRLRANSSAAIQPLSIEWASLGAES